MQEIIYLILSLARGDFVFLPFFICMYRVPRILELIFQYHLPLYFPVCLPCLPPGTSESCLLLCLQTCLPACLQLCLRPPFPSPCPLRVSQLVSHCMSHCVGLVSQLVSHYNIHFVSNFVCHFVSMLNAESHKMWLKHGSYSRTLSLEFSLLLDCQAGFNVTHTTQNFVVIFGYIVETYKLHGFAHKPQLINTLFGDIHILGQVPSMFAWQR